MNNNRNILEGAIQQGIILMRNHNLTEQQFKIWLEYSRNLLSLASKNNALMINYHTVIYAANNRDLSVYQKLSMCLQYLISIQGSL